MHRARSVKTENMLKFFVILFIAVWAVKAYDLLDVSSSQQNEDVHSGSADSKTHSDSRSDRNTCCVGDKLNPVYSKQTQELKKQCAIQFRTNNSNVQNFDPFDCESMTQIKEIITCEEECFARATNQIDESGKFNRESIKQHYAQHTVGDIEWKKTALDGYIDSCLNQVTENKQQQQSHQQCSNAAMDFHYCIWDKFRNGCPVELRINSPKCIKMRKELSEGSEQLFHRQLFFKFMYKTPGFRG